jgi:hypothetical protein
VIAHPVKPAVTLPPARLVARQPRTPWPERVATLDAHELPLHNPALRVFPFTVRRVGPPLARPLNRTLPAPRRPACPTGGSAGTPRTAETPHSAYNAAPSADSSTPAEPTRTCSAWVARPAVSLLYEFLSRKAAVVSRRVVVGLGPAPGVSASARPRKARNTSHKLVYDGLHWPCSQNSGRSPKVRRRAF